MVLSGDILLELFLTSLSYWWVIIPSVLFGILVGAIPGFGAHNTIIILLPFTLAVDVELALIFMVSLYAATHLGGGIPAILVKIPGTGGAAATTLDGHPMAVEGRAQHGPGDVLHCLHRWGADHFRDNPFRASFAGPDWPAAA